MIFSFRCTNQPGPLYQLSWFFCSLILLHSLMLFFVSRKLWNACIVELLMLLMLLFVSFYPRTKLSAFTVTQAHVVESRLLTDIYSRKLNNEKRASFFWPEGINMNNLGHILRQTGTFSFNICIWIWKWMFWAQLVSLGVHQPSLKPCLICFCFSFDWHF